MKEIIECTQTLYQKASIEIQYILYQSEGAWKAEQVSANGTPHSADLIYEYVFDAIRTIKSRGVKDVYVVHNHPATHPKPSFMDYYNYETLHAFLSLSGLHLCDYLIVSVYGYYSFEESGRLQTRPLHSSVVPAYESPVNLTTVMTKEGYEAILELLTQHNEIMVTKDGTFAGSPLDLLSLSTFFEKFKGNHLFFTNNTSDEQKTRLADIYRTWSPIEIFQLDKGKFSPMIADGIIQD